MKRFLKKYKKIIIIIICILILLFIGKLFYQIMFSDTERLYGNRLDGISKVELSKKDLKGITDELESNNNIKEANYDQKGRIYNFVIKVEEDVNISEIVSLSSKVIDKFDDSQKEFFDVQIFITTGNDEKLEKFPVIGYRKKGLESKFSWANYNS